MTANIDPGMALKVARKDAYFIKMCETVASICRCPARQLGAVIVRPDGYIVSTGYNGPPSGFPNPGTARFKQIAEDMTERLGCYAPDWTKSDCTRRALGVTPGEDLDLCPCAHAERNAISAAARTGVATSGCTLYLNSTQPCLDCAYSIVNAGIVEVVASGEPYLQPRLTGEIILRESGITVRKAKI